MDAHAVFGRHAVLGAVDVASKGDAVFVYGDEAAAGSRSVGARAAFVAAAGFALAPAFALPFAAGVLWLPVDDLAMWFLWWRVDASELLH